MSAQTASKLGEQQRTACGELRSDIVIATKKRPRVRVLGWVNADRQTVFGSLEAESSTTTSSKRMPLESRKVYKRLRDEDCTAPRNLRRETLEAQKPQHKTQQREGHAQVQTPGAPTTK